MTRPAPSRPSAELERQLDAYTASARANGSQRWKKNLFNGSAYAAAAGSALAFATAAEAGIMYSGPLNDTISLIANNGTRSVLKNSTMMTLKNLGARLRLRFVSGLTSSGGFRKYGRAIIDGVNHSFNLLASGPNAANLRMGSKISAGVGFKAFGRIYGRASFPPFKPRDFGQWTHDLVPGYVGFRFATGTISNKPQYHYGWISLAWDDPLMAYRGFPQTLTVYGWAYNTVVGAPIQAGQTPEPDSLLLALIATGATGVQLWRRSRQTRAGQES
jgi:hypothetical protein